jgi:hypothetical protein
MDKELHLLEKHLPPGAAAEVLNALRLAKVFLRITRKRRTKLGDFRPATPKRPHRITVNQDLNPYEFLFTLLHELAHHEAFLRYGRKHKPHGPQWKAIFSSMVQPFLQKKVFPADLEQSIIEHFEKEGITDCSDSSLREAFHRYDTYNEHDQNPKLPTVDLLPFNSKFALPDGRQFIKLELRRKRFSCYCFDNKRFYVFGPKVQVIPINELLSPGL